MAFGTLDISIISDHLIKLIEDCVDNTALWGTPPIEKPVITVTGNAPDVIHEAENCTIGLYLFHASPDPYQRNRPVTDDRTTRVPRLSFRPLSLDFYYMLFAYSKDDYVNEQRAMSVAMKCLHEDSFAKGVMLANDGRPECEYVLKMEILSADDIGRLWQSFAVANRFSVVYKVRVEYIQPEED